MTDSILTQLSNEVEFRPEDYLLAAAALRFVCGAATLSLEESERLGTLSRLFRAKSALAELAECNIIDMDGEDMIDAQQLEGNIKLLKQSMPKTFQKQFTRGLAC